MNTQHKGLQFAKKAFCVLLAVFSILTFFSCSNVLQGEKGSVSLDISGLTGAMSGVQAFSRARLQAIFLLW